MFRRSSGVAFRGNGSRGCRGELDREDDDAGELRAEALEVFRVLGDDNGIEQRRCRDDEGVDRELTVDVLCFCESHTGRLRDVDGAYDLRGTKDLVPSVRSSAPPFRDDGKRNDDPNRADLGQAQKTGSPLFSAFRRDERSGVEDVAGDQATLRFLAFFFAVATSASSSA